MIISTETKTVKSAKYSNHFNYTYRYYSDHTIEFMLYDENQLIGKNGGRRLMTDSRKDISEEKRELYRYQARMRAGSKIRQLVEENNLYIMWSLSYAEDVTDRAQAIYDYKKFVQRLNYQLNTKIPYVAVIEVQRKREKRTGKAVLHFHMAIDRYIDKHQLQEIWGHGNVFYTKYDNGKPISGDKGSVAGYMSKYLKKDMQDNPNLTGKKMYLSSHGLKRPNEGYGVISKEEQQEIKNIASKSYEIETGKNWCRLNVNELMKKANIEKEQLTKV